MASFEKEKGRVMLLMQRLDLAPDEYRDPSAGGAGETGADVVAVFGNRRIGIQVTDLDTGDEPGSARKEESGLFRAAEARNGGTYGTWAQNDPSRVMAAIVRSLTRKSRMSCAGFNEFWLLMCAGVPELGAIGATFVITPWLTTDALDAETLQILAASKYSRAFIHIVLGVEEKAVYQWQCGAGWSKSTIELPRSQRARDFWDYKNDPDLLSDPIGWRKREIKRVLAELRGTGGTDQ
jgi:hypothetical protein